MASITNSLFFCLISTSLAQKFFANTFGQSSFVRNIEQIDNPLRNDRLINSDQSQRYSNNDNINSNNMRLFNSENGRIINNERNTKDRNEINSPYDINDNQRPINTNQNSNFNQNTYRHQNAVTERDYNNERNLNNQYSNTNQNVYRNGVTEGYGNQNINTNQFQNGLTDRTIYNNRNLNRNSNTNQNTDHDVNSNNNYQNNQRNDVAVTESNNNRNSNHVPNLQHGSKRGGISNNNNRNNQRNFDTDKGQSNLKNTDNFDGEGNSKISNNVTVDESNDMSNMTTTEKDIWTKIGRGIQKEIRDIKHPVEQGITSVASSKCSSVKKLVGVAYEQIAGEKEPDLNQLALAFRTRSIQISYNITSAARLIPEARNYNPSKKLYIFIHGFTDDPYKNSFGNISEALLKQGECNVLALDGSSLIHWLYLRSTTYVRFMGEKLGEVLAAMVKDGVDPASIHVIGHSLGSHISGFTGKTFQDLTGRKLGRISGLDPAGPCFSHIDDDLRLKATDADFVDVMHTDAGVFGIADPVGQVDYYPNEGYQQPNCVFQTCSHSRAWLYYAESVVSPRAFPAVKCADWQAFKKGECKEISYMGFPSKPGTAGTYYLQTGEDSPYGKGLNGTKFEDDESVVRKISGLIGKKK